MKKKIIRHKPQKKMRKLPKSTLVIAAIALAVPIIGLLGWNLIPAVQLPAVFEIGNPNGTVALSLTPGIVTLTPNSEQTLTLSIDAGTTKVTAVQVEIAYDESKIGIPTITKGAFLTNELIPAKAQNGKISFIYTAPNELDANNNINVVPKTGTGTLATITIKPTIVGTSSLSFTETSAVTALDAGGSDIPHNVLKSVGNTTFTVSQAEASTIASANPSATPSKPSTVKPAKPTNLRSNCYDGGNKITLRWDSVAEANSYKLRLNQTDGADDKSIDNITGTEYNISLLPDQKYSWWVHSVKDGIDSEEARVDTVTCAQSLAAVSATPTNTPTPTQQPTTKPVAQATIKPTVKVPTPTIKASIKPAVTITQASSPLPIPSSLAADASWGSLSDIYPDGLPETSATKPAETNFFLKIIYGWRAIFQYIFSFF